MKSTPRKIKVSAIASCYNGERYLPEFLNNCAEQTIREQVEIILVHNEPSESELRIVRNFQELYPGLVKHIVVQRESLPVSTNRALLAASGEYVCIWNVDDLRTKNSLELMTATLDSAPDIYFTYGDYIRVNQWMKKEGELFTWPEFDKRRFARSMMLGPFYMWRRGVCHNIGYWDEQFISAADFEYAVRLTKESNGKKTEGLLGYYLNEGSGLSTNGSARNRVEGTLIQLRYATYKDLHLAYVFRAMKLKRYKVLQKGQWVSLESLCPNYKCQADNMFAFLYAIARNAYWIFKIPMVKVINRYLGSTK